MLWRPEKTVEIAVVVFVFFTIIAQKVNQKQKGCESRKALTFTYLNHFSECTFQPNECLRNISGCAVIM